MDKEQVISKLIAYRALLTQYFEIDKMVLFGSYAKGIQRDDSDIDVAIFVNSFNSNKIEPSFLWSLRRKIDSRIEPILIENNHDPSGFGEEILKYGLTI